MAVREILTRFPREFSLRHLRWWQWLVLLVMGVGIIVRVWLPGFIQQQVVSNLTTLTTAQIILGDVNLNLLRGHLALQHLSFTLAGEERPVLAIRDIAINLRLRSLLRQALDIETLILTGVRVEAVQEPNGQLNFTRLFPPSSSEPQTEPTDLPTLTLEEFQILDSQMTYHDRTRHGEPNFVLAVSDLTAKKIDLQPRGFVTPVALQLTGALDQSPLQGKAHILWQREQSTVDANIELQHLALTALEPYLQDTLAFHKLNGQLGTQLHYRYHIGGGAPPAHKLAGTVTVENLQIADPLSQHVALTLPKGQIDIETVNFAQQDIRVTSVGLQDLKVAALQTPTGLNLAALIRATKQEKTTTAPPWKFTLQTVKWTGGELQYRDSTWPETETLVVSPEVLELQNFGSEATEHPFRFRARMSEGTIAGDGTMQLAPFTMQGQLQPEGVEVALLRPFLSGLMPGKSLQGKVSGSMRAELNPQGTEAGVRFNGRLETAKFLVDGVPEAGSSLSWERGHIEIGEGSTITPLTLHLQPQLSRLLFHRPSQTDLAIEQINGTVTLTSPTVAGGQPPLLFSGTLATTQLTLIGIPEAGNEFRWESSQIDIGNGSTLTPLALEVTIQLAKVSLQRLPQGDVAIEKASATLRLAQEEHTQQERILRLQGPIDLTGFVLTHGPEKKVLLACYHATAKIAEDSRVWPFDVHLLEVALEYTYGQGMRTPAGQFQLFIPPVQTPDGATLPDTPSSSSSVPPRETPAAEPSSAMETETLASLTSPPTEVQPTQTANGFTMRIDHLSMIGGELYFEDRTVTPTQTIYWQDVRVNVNTVSYPLAFPATFSVFAYNEEGAPVEFQGTTEQRGKQTVMRVRGNVQKMSLSRFNPYLEPSLGYRVNKGKVTATWDLVLPGDRIQANMKVTLHDIGLGGKRETSQLEQQVGLPLTLIIGLLKDLNGNINLRIPVEGRIDEPGFHWRGTIIRAIRDVLLGAITSPLKFLGAIFKRKDELEDFTFQPLQFIPGTSDMTEDAKAQLGRVSQFLAQRPELDLRLSGTAGAADLQRLKDHTILSQLTTAAVPPPQQLTNTTESSTVPPLPLSPQDEVRQFLTQQLHPLDHPSPEPLSESAATLLKQLRKKTIVPPQAMEHLIEERLQTVTTLLTTQYAVAAARIHIHPEKQPGPGAAEVRYVIQTREEGAEEAQETPPEKKKAHKKEEQ